MYMISDCIVPALFVVGYHKHTYPTASSLYAVVFTGARLDVPPKPNGGGGAVAIATHARDRTVVPDIVTSIGGTSPRVRPTCTSAGTSSVAAHAAADNAFNRTYQTYQPNKRITNRTATVEHRFRCDPSLAGPTENELDCHR